MTAPFSTRMRVRLSDVDSQQHATSATYIQFANQALWECVNAAGVDVPAMVESGLGPVNLEMNVRFLHELRAGADVDVSCELAFSAGKTYSVRCDVRVGAEVAAVVTSTVGLLDLGTRRLRPDPAADWRRLAARPAVLGLS